MREINTQDKRFIDGNGRDVLGTVVTADWLNAVQDELTGLVRGFGGTVTPSTPNQIYQLVRAALDLLAAKNAIINAGNGLTGGGDLSASRTISMGTPSTITGSSANSVGSNTHSHAIDKASTTAAGIVQLENTLTSNLTTRALTAAQGKVLQDSKLGNTGDQILNGALRFSAAGYLGRQGVIGVGADDVWMHNPVSGSYLALKDNGELHYKNNKVADYSDFVNQRAESGYQKLPNGLIIQWGKGTAGAAGVNFTNRLPVSFPVACVNVQAIHIGDDYAVNVTVNGMTLTGFNARSSYQASQVSIYWFAIGY